MNENSRSQLLVVAEEPARLHALCEALGREGYRARGCASPREALAALRGGGFDLLLADLGMPGMGGIDLIGEARQIDPEIGAIVMADDATIDTALQAMQGGATDFLLKPLRSSVVLQVVARTLEHRRLRRQNALLLAQARHQAAELTAARHDLDAFSYSISHDLRAPLLFVKDFAQRLEEEYPALPSEDVRSIVRLIRDGSRSMDDMVVGLIAFSRATRQPLEPVRLDMEPVVRAALTDVLGQYSGPEPQIELGALPPAFADSAGIHHVWFNLISNALKFSATRAQPQVRIGGRVEGSEVVYTVEDNGVGFDMRYADKLFKVFKRLHSPDEFPGSGVGLAIAHRIVGRHGGRMWAESSPGAGATFHFLLPEAP